MSRKISIVIKITRRSRKAASGKCCVKYTLMQKELLQSCVTMPISDIPHSKVWKYIFFYKKNGAAQNTALLHFCKLSVIQAFGLSNF